MAQPSGSPCLGSHGTTSLWDRAWLKAVERTADTSFDSWLTVVASDNTKAEIHYINQCGVAKAFCVSTPGSTVSAAKADSGYKLIHYSGTSMSAPHISRIAALLMQKFPSSSTKAIATWIKKTSSLEGLSG